VTRLPVEQMGEIGAVVRSGLFQMFGNHFSSLLRRAMSWTRAPNLTDIKSGAPPIWEVDTGVFDLGSFITAWVVRRQRREGDVCRGGQTARLGRIPLRKIRGALRRAMMLHAEMMERPALHQIDW
jgi:hypothetical protein